MPSRNIVKLNAATSYYHIYARGASKQPIFHEPDDYEYFIGLFARYLSNAPVKSATGVPYPHYVDTVELSAYCLMTNHFHLLIYQIETGAMTRLMRSILTSYSRYFNQKYERSGALFESTYKASRIDTQSYVEHISRYIHLNPRYWQRYAYSSIHFYTHGGEPEYLKLRRILDMFPSRSAYLLFLKDYEGHKAMIEKIKYELADR